MTTNTTVPDDGVLPKNIERIRLRTAKARVEGLADTVDARKGGYA
jgi:hypothetical protein